METVDPRMLQAGPSSPPARLKLTIPSLKMLRERVDSAKSKGSPVLAETESSKKLARPPKLKPLKEVLATLITKIKKKDDYAFFLNPVDTTAIPGYLDVIQRPMDFGTMTTKVERGRYRSLEEFASDFRLVISNAKTFNPPGTIYYTEAERIDNWASDQISRSSAQVIEYETDWNIDVEHDEPASADDDDGNLATREEMGTPSRRSPSAVPGGSTGGRRRGKAESVKPGLTDVLEPDGHLPGWKDGLGAFPPGSSLAETMVALKLKGKRYKTKKERLKIERSGPPYAADSSLDYAELEDPFTVLSALVPDPVLSRPLLKPLHDPPPLSEPYPVPPPVNRSMPDQPPLPVQPTAPPSGQRYRHWAISRTGPSRRAKEREKESEIEEVPVDPRPPRPPVATDFGAYTMLAQQLFAHPEQLLSESALFAELAKRDVVGGNVEARAAQAWVREVVYGGVEGLAYLRSLAEFTSSPESQRYAPALGTSLASYVESNVVDDITRSTHRMLHAITAYLSPARTPLPADLARTIALLPLRARIDLAALIRDPQELYDAEKTVAGRDVAEALKHVGEMLERMIDGRTNSDSQDIVMTDGLTEVAKDDDVTMSAREEEEEEEEDGAKKASAVKMEDEDQTQKEVRLSLVALAMRAPIEQIAPMPAALLPAHVQGKVPMLG